MKSLGKAALVIISNGLKDLSESTGTAGVGRRKADIIHNVEPPQTFAESTPLGALGFLLLAWIILPGMFVGICVLMNRARVPNPPYLVYFAIFSSIGSLLMGLTLETSPLMALCFYYSLMAAPILLVRSFFFLRARNERSLYHRAAMWVSAFCAASLISLLAFLAWKHR